MDSLVVETRTLWDSELGELSEEDKSWLADRLHQEPHKATRIHYERTHTGFTREITVTTADVERLYREQFEES